MNPLMANIFADVLFFFGVGLLGTAFLYFGVIIKRCSLRHKDIKDHSWFLVFGAICLFVWPLSYIAIVFGSFDSAYNNIIRLIATVIVFIGCALSFYGSFCFWKNFPEKKKGLCFDAY